MNDSVIISSQVIDGDKLGDLIEQLDDLAQASTHVQLQYVVTSDSPAVLSVLHSLFPTPVPVEKPRKVRKAKANGHEPKASSVALKKKPRGASVKSWEIVGGNAPVESIGEKFSRFEINRNLAGRRYSAGLKFHHPKHGIVTVKASPSPSEPQTLINEQGERL